MQRNFIQPLHSFINSFCRQSKNRRGLCDFCLSAVQVGRSAFSDMFEQFHRIDLSLVLRWEPDVGEDGKRISIG